MCVLGGEYKASGRHSYTDLHEGQKSGTTEFDSVILAIEIPLLRSSYCTESSRKLTWASAQAKTLSHVRQCKYVGKLYVFCHSSVLNNLTTTAPLLMREDISSLW